MQLAILIRLPAHSHAPAAAVCSAFKALMSNSEFKIQRRAAGYEEQYLVAAAGYGGNCCADAGCAVRTASGWARLPDLPPHMPERPDLPGVSESAAVVVGDSFYLLGGEGSGEPGTGTDSVFSIQPHRRGCDLSWHYEPKMPASLCYHVAGAHDGIIVVTGGRCDDDAQGWYGETGTSSASTFRFNVESGTWTEGARMPAPRQGAVGAVIDGVLHVLGGFAEDWEGGDEDGRVYDGAIVYSYDVAANTWKERAPSGRHVVQWSTYHDVISAVAKGGKMYLLSKETAFTANSYSTTIHLYIFDPATFTFTRGPDLPSNRSTGYGGVRLGVFNGEVTAVGLFRDQGCYVLDECREHWNAVTPAEGATHFVCPMTSVATVYK
ncbi:hypothetical protein EMIHUDRAFT_117388 [Emiliania huxleyi CCMP1516]|uniref:Uncharacterized protein n=2 Tax=Emiliania huxleyi TaxID=2903 RepID=A0A0D3JC64_EMIH1|nr:hypothetical protein EMIHUDRAFT_117388 [Emiliania huxleyi CCMP1516]EOD21099.1 hypothetical protein EMIHUDRAFT_117388 [Emiliania huxleyi CCMP1516]|eukprot:XP_005773528.1 hypothetical protein EMIHUDRAFT_117388 [Emiliania huxleyi CCMP1516]